MKKLFTLFLVTLIGSIQGLEVGAQTKTIKKKKAQPTEQNVESEDAPQKKKKDSKTIQVFDETDDYTAPGVEVKRKIEAYNVLKINPWGAIIGMYSASYERVVTPTLSGEVTLGMTKLYGSEGLVTDELLSSAKNAFWQSTAMQSLETGLVFGLTARYYVGKRTHIPEGSYLMGGFQTRSYRFTENAFIQPEVRGTAVVPSSLKETDLVRLMFGYQTLGSSSFTWDFYIGGAYRTVTSDGPYSTATQFFNGQRTLSTGPILLVGCKLGIAF